MKIEQMKKIVIELRNESYKWNKAISDLDKYISLDTERINKLKSNYLEHKKFIETEIARLKNEICDITDDLCVICNKVYSDEEMQYSDHYGGMVCSNCVSNDPDEENFSSRESDRREQDEFLDQTPDF